MSGKNGKPAAALLLGVLILISAALFANMVYRYADESWRHYALWAVAIVVFIWLLIELRNIVHYVRASRNTDTDRPPENNASTLVLMNEDIAGIQTWDLRNKVGLVIGRSHDDADVDVDLSHTEYFSIISNYHAVLNFTNKGWMLADAGSQNGTALLRQGWRQKLLLTPGEPVPIQPGDTIYIAEETVLSVR